MKRLVITLLLLAFTSLMSYSKVKDGSNFEIGGIYAFAFSKANDGSNYNISGPGAYFEYRFEYPSQFYVGARLDYRYAYGPGHEYDEEGIRYNTNYNQFCIKVLGGYTFCPGAVVNPFVGIGIGGGLLYTNRIDNKNHINYSFVLTPRVGVQVSRFRLSCDIDLLCDGYNYSRSGWSVSTITTRKLSIHTTIVSLNLGFSF